MDLVYLHCGPTAAIIYRHPDFMQRDKDGKLKLTRWGFPGINFANSGTREYFRKNMEHWVRDFDVDGFRCDVSDGIPLDFWETSRDWLEKIKPDVGMLAEGTRKADQIKAFDVDYGWWGGKFDNAAKLRRDWERMHDERPRGGARFIRFIENHDLVEDEGLNRLDRAWGTPRVNAVLTAIFTLDGVPFLYNGQEVADTSRNSLYAKWPVDWSAGETPAGKARFAFCQKLCALRSAEKTLTQGTVVWLDNDQADSVLSFLRRTSGEEMLSVVNLSARPIRVRITLAESTAWPGETVIAEGAKIESDGSGLTLNLAGFGYLVARQK